MGHSVKTAHTLMFTVWERLTLGKEQAPGARAARVQVWLCHLLGVADGPAHIGGEPRRGEKIWNNLAGNTDKWFEPLAVGQAGPCP